MPFQEQDWPDHDYAFFLGTKNHVSRFQSIELGESMHFAVDNDEHLGDGCVYWHEIVP